MAATIQPLRPSAVHHLEGDAVALQVGAHERIDRFAWLRGVALQPVG